MSSKVLPFDRSALTSKTFVLGIDVGGQSIKPALYEVLGSTVAPEPAWQPEQNPGTLRGVVVHIDQVAEIIKRAQQEAITLGGKIAAIGIASPGRFRADGTIKPGSSPNMGIYESEFDNINLKQRYAAALAAKAPQLCTIPLNVANDGNAMLAGMVEDIVKDRTVGKPLYDHTGEAIGKTSLLRKQVAVLGIGSGLGHAIATIDDKGAMDFVTDGHASKLRIKVDDDDLAMIKKAATLMNTTEKTEVMIFSDNTVRAEDLFRDPVLKALAGVANAKDIDYQNNGEHKKIVQFAGKYVGRLISQIRSGESTDVEPDNGWDKNQKEQAAKTDTYLIGGGVGSSALGAAMIKIAAQELETQGLGDIRLVQYTRENPATRAAATMVPSRDYINAQNAAVS